MTAPGWSGMQGGFGASIRVAGETRELASATGTAVGSVRDLTESTPYGEAGVAEMTLHYENEQVDLLLRLGRVPGVPGVLAQAGIRNGGNQSLELVSLTALDLTIKADGLPVQWLITGFHNPVAAVTALSELAKPLDVHEAGGFYHSEGKGFWFGPVGTPTACINARFSPVADGRVVFNLTSEMSGARVDPGETRWGQQVVLLVEQPDQAVARWSEWVGKTHGARTTKGALTGWNSWNFFKGKDPRGEVLDVVAAVRESGGRLRPGVIQIDDALYNGRSMLDAPWLPEVAQQVGKIGARFGLRLAFEHAPNPEVAGVPMEIGEITATVRRAVHSGFSYLKVSCDPALKRVAGEKRTAFEIQRDTWSAIRQAAGEETYLLFCSHSYRPERAVVGCVDASRVGLDAGRRTLPSVILGLRPYAPLNGRWFAVDNDVYYLTAEPEFLVVAGGPVAVQTWRSIVGLSGGAAITSTPWYWGTFRENWRYAEVMTPPAGGNARMLGLGTSAVWNGLVGHVRRDWGDSTVAVVWNVGKKEQACGKVDFAAAGMDPNKRYAVWSFWDNQFLGIAKGAWTTPMLAESASQHLCFTDLDRTPNQPVLIGSNLHIYCGAAEIQRVTCTRGAMQIDLTDAGARDGDLWVYSRWPLVFKAARGCALKDVASTGDNVWRISLMDRQHGQPQRVELEIRLPVTRRLWFWLVVALVVASLGFGAWRYGVALRLERRHGLDEERARIARDLHDEIGAKLTRISLLGAMAAEDAKGDARLRREVKEMADSARATHLAFDEIVWSVNPRNDTVHSLIHYICRHAEEFFGGTPVSCHFRLPETVPDHPLPPLARHQLFLAVKEGLNNILKHAAATTVEVVIRIADGILRVELDDNGCGFDPNMLDQVGDGLRNLRQRMQEAGGVFTLVSSPGAGTRLTFEIPLSAKSLIRTAAKNHKDPSV
jgi:signal transduction histidine kinase